MNLTYLIYILLLKSVPSLSEIEKESQQETENTRTVFAVFMISISDQQLKLAAVLVLGFIIVHVWPSLNVCVLIDVLKTRPFPWEHTLNSDG